MKTRWDLVPWAAMEQVARVLTEGEAKHGDSWRQVPKSQHFPAMMRHVVAWVLGDNADPETGLPPLAHAVCRALFIIAQEEEEEEES